MSEELKECFKIAEKEEKKGKKHKGLLKINPSIENAKQYLIKSKECLKFCGLYKQLNTDYKIPEEWYYALYYCALAVISKFGIESRSQRCTALFLRYAKDKGLINYNDEFIDRIMVYKEKDKITDVDQREEARYGPKIKLEEVSREYDKMMGICKEAISQAEEIVFLANPLEIPQELLN